jgi:hypothetical protein
MKISRAIALVSLVCAATAGLALPSQAAPLYGQANSFHGGYNTGIVPPHLVNNYGHNRNNNIGYNGYNGHSGYNNRFNNGFGNNFYGNGNNFNFGGNINAQIQAGLSSGALTRSEANRLMSQQAKINNLRARLASNGLSARDRQILSNDYSRLQASLAREMSDSQTARRWW